MGLRLTSRRHALHRCYLVFVRMRDVCLSCSAKQSMRSPYCNLAKLTFLGLADGRFRFIPSCSCGHCSALLIASFLHPERV
jgi:hypothetical protein